jgi:hypothetical protein
MPGYPPQIAETIAARPTFADELIGIVPAGAVTHLIFACLHFNAEYGGTYREVQARLVVPTDQVQKIGKALLSGRLDLPAPRDGDEGGEPVGLH